MHVQTQFSQSVNLEWQTTSAQTQKYTAHTQGCLLIIHTITYMHVKAVDRIMIVHQQHYIWQFHAVRSADDFSKLTLEKFYCTISNLTFTTIKLTACHHILYFTLSKLHSKKQWWLAGNYWHYVYTTCIYVLLALSQNCKWANKI